MIDFELGNMVEVTEGDLEGMEGIIKGFVCRDSTPYADIDMFVCSDPVSIPLSQLIKL